MKKNKTNLLENRGSMLILTLIVFMVILILGMTMITSMLYSQGENNMQINRQKAYYAAQSAADAVKSYFLNPSSTDKPYDLIETTGRATGTYTLKDQGIDEETTVDLKITRGGKVPGEENKYYILIEAVGNCQGEKSKVTVKLIEEEKKGGTGLYSSKVVFGSSIFKLNASEGSPLKVIGNIFIDDADLGSDGINISGIDLSLPNEDGEDSTLYIYSEKTPITLSNNKLKDVFIQFAKSIHVTNNEMNNFYARTLTEGNSGGMSFNSNKIEEEAQLFIGTIYPNIVSNKIGERLMVGVTREELPGWTITSNEVDEVYIKGAKKIGAITGTSNKPINVLYTDAITYENRSDYHINQIVERNLSELDDYEQKIASVMDGLEQTSKVIKDKTTWDKSALSSSFIKLEPGEGSNNQDPINSDFEEYYDPNRKIRLVFSDSNAWHTIKKKKGNETKGWYTYYVSNKSEHEEDQIFFIAENAQGVKFETDSEDKFEAFYLYAPNAQCEFSNNFQYFKGSIIVRYIGINASVQATFIFKEPENIEGIGVPGDSDSSGDTSYTYYFKEYVDEP